ncbi:MAG: hydrogenase maturation nickel metallochaperone HypA [Chloroflexota bacterium]|nr:MAG: hydrogenase maturation nickel metallochaperone HypA [Anaerolineaceae bacterium 4572_5.2]RLD04760.1 MAG: hydrogenase maturation nickel metallochaperone HypA [Chloroflexota bacterium]
MHELAITQRIAEIAIQHAEDNNASRITALYLVLGNLSSVVDDSVQFYWDIVTKDTLCEGATLHFQRVPAKLQCQNCGHTYILTDGKLSSCPLCDSIDIHVIQGKEFRLESIEIE